MKRVEVEAIHVVYHDHRLPRVLNGFLATAHGLLGRFGCLHFRTVDGGDFCAAEPAKAVWLDLEDGA